MQKAQETRLQEAEERISWRLLTASPRVLANTPQMIGLDWPKRSLMQLVANDTAQPQED